MDISGTAVAGTIIPAGPESESPNRLSPDSVHATGGEIEYAFNTGNELPFWLDATGRPSNLTLLAGWARYSGDDKATRSVLSGGVDTGLLFTRPPKSIDTLPTRAGSSRNWRSVGPSSIIA